MGLGPRQKQVRDYRGQIPSPGRPTVAWREDRVRFWAAIARGIKTEDACVEARVSGPVGFRWFRHAGGVNPRLTPTVSGRYLSSPNVRTSRFGTRRKSALARSPAGWAAIPRRSPANCAVTRPRGPTTWTTRRRSRSGTHSAVVDGRKSRNSPTTDSATTSRTACPVSFTPSTARWSDRPGRNGKGESHWV